MTTTLFLLVLACGGESTAPPPATSPAPQPPAPPPAAAAPAPEEPAAQPWLPDEPRAVDPAVQQAADLVAAGKATEALPLLDQRLAAAPEDADALYWRGRAKRAGEEPASGEADLRRATELAPQWLAAHQELADLLVVDRRCDQALPHLELIATALPEAGQARANLGFCRIKTGDGQGGLADLETACTLKYEWACQQATHLRRQLERAAPPSP